MAIARQQFDIFHRQEQTVAARIFQRNAFMRRAHRRDGFQPRIPPHTMVDMHNQITGRQALRFSQEILGAFAPFGASDQPFAQHVLFGNYGQVRRFKALIQRPDCQKQPPLGRGANLARSGDVLRCPCPVVFQQARQPFARAVRMTGNHHIAQLAPVIDMRGQRVKDIRFRLPFGGKAAAHPPASIHNPRPRCGFQGLQLKNAAR